MNEKELKEALQKDMKKLTTMNFNHIVLKKSGIEPKAERKDCFNNESIVVSFLMTTLGFGLSYYLPVSEETGLVIKVAAVLIPLAFMTFNLISNQIHNINPKS